MKKTVWWFVAVVLGLHLLLLVNLQFTAWPEMLAYPFLWVKGFSLYGDLVYPYPPLLVVILGGIFSLFGFQVEVLERVTWVWILASDAVLFLLARLWLKKMWLALVVVGFYAVLMTVLDGNMMWFDNAVVLPILLLGYVLTRWFSERRRKWVILAGVALAVAVLIKQTVGLFGIVPFLVVMGWGRRERWLSLLALVAPVAIALGGLFLFLWVRGEWGSFWNWVIYYPFNFWIKFPGYVNFDLQGSDKTTLILLSLPVVLGIFSSRLRKEKFFWLALGFVGVGAIVVYPRWSFFHLQSALPFLALLFGLVWSKVEGLRKVGMILVMSLILVRVIWPGLRSAWGGEVRFWQGADKKMVEMIEENVGENGRVFLQGLPASYYVLANRLPPVHWADNFGWYLEMPGVQEWVIGGFEKERPEQVFWRVPSRGNWYDLGTYQPEKIVNYVRANYTLEGKPVEGIELWTRKD